MSQDIHAVIGTAGHVDHGKTTLIHHLTGIATDRLKEEQDRGISIELGFAWLDLPLGRVAVVDVPGHERFVRQMIAGAAGIDVVLLVVAADEGVMPQTHEHLDICQLLGVRRGGVVITKVDLVDEEWLELVEDDIATAVAGTFLEGAPIATYARGDDEAADRVRALVSTLVEAAEETGELGGRGGDRPFKMSIDRVFTMRGFGTVVTGTTAAGAVRVGDAVSLLPGDVRGRVRGIQLHGETVNEVTAGARAAINLQGVDLDLVHRGDVLCEPEGLTVTSMFDAMFRAPARLAEAVSDRTRALIHIGTAQIEGTIALMEGRDELAPGEACPVQIRLDSPTAVLPGESFIARGFTVLAGYGKTIGGGRALTPVARRYRRRATDEVALVEALDGGAPRAMLEALAWYEDQRGVPTRGLSARLPISRDALERVTGELVADGTLIPAEGALYHARVLDELAPRATAAVREFHDRRPALPGISPEELRTRIRDNLPQDVLGALLRRLAEAGELELLGEGVRVPGFEPRRSAAQDANTRAVHDALRAGGLTPPRVQDLPEELDLSEERVAEALELLVMDRGVVRVAQHLFYDAATMADLHARLVAHLQEHGTIDTGGFKELTGTSRKWTIPLQEYFDRIRLTLRVGDRRRLRSEG